MGERYTDFDTPDSACRICGYPFDAASGVAAGSEPPCEGDYSICLNCGALAVFNADATLRPITDAERAEVPDEAIAYIAVIKTRGRFRE